MSDVLFQVRNQFQLGAFQGAINEAQDMEALSDIDKVERDVLVYRSYIALGNVQLVVSEIPDDAAAALLAVKLYGQYLLEQKAKDDVVATLQEWLSDPVTALNPTVALMTGTIYARDGNYVEALKACHGGNGLETQALMVQVYLAMDRPDQAEKVVKAMSTVDDDATMTQLASAWTDLALGGKKVQEAAFIYDELGERHGWTAKLHNGRAVADMKMGRWEEAEHGLQDALRKDNNDPDALANMIACALHAGKPHARYLNQLKMQSPSHALVSKFNAAEDAFSRAALSVQ